MQLVPYKHKVHYYETDKMGIVHHSNYIRWFEECRVDYLDQVSFSYKQVEERGVYFPVLGVECQYKSMVRFGETVEIEMVFTQLTKTRMSFGYHLRDAETGELRTIGETHHRYMQEKNHRPVQLPKVIPELYEIFCHMAG